MNYPPISKSNTRNTIEIPHNKRPYNNNQFESNNKNYKTSERKGISLTPDRQFYKSNSSREIHSNSSAQKYNPRLLDNRNSSAKKTDYSNLNDNGNPKEKQFQKDFSQISINNHDYSTISKLSNKSMAQAHLDRRHLETQQKINRLRHEKLTQESSELKFKPLISDNSKKIIKNLISKEQAIKVISNPNPINNLNTDQNQYAAGGNYNNASNQNANYINSYNYINSLSNQKNAPVKPQYSQLDDYRKIAEKRENLVHNAQRQTIDNDSRNSNKTNIRPSSAKPPNRSNKPDNNSNNQYNTAQKGFNNERDIDRMIINNDQKLNTNIYSYSSQSKIKNTANYNQAPVKYNNSYLNNDNNTSNLSNISEKKNSNNYSINNNSNLNANTFSAFKPNSNANVNLKENKFSPMAMPPKPGYSSIKRPNSGSQGIRGNNSYNVYNNYNNQTHKKQNFSNGNNNNSNQHYTGVNNIINNKKDTSYLSERGTNSKDGNNSFYERNQYNNNNVNRGLNNYYNEKSFLDNKTNQNSSYYSNSSKNNNETNITIKKQVGSSNPIIDRNTTNTIGNTYTRSPIPIGNRAGFSNYNSNPNPKILNSNIKNNLNNKNTYQRDFNNSNPNNKINANLYRNNNLNNPDNSKNSNLEYRSNHNPNLNYHNNLNNNAPDNIHKHNNNYNQNNKKSNHNPASNEAAANFSFHNNHMLESQQVKNIDFNEFDQFSPPNNPNSNINYRETEEKEKTNLIRNQTNFDSKLNYDHHRKNDANLLLNFAENLKNNLNSDNYANYNNDSRISKPNYQSKSNSYNPHENLNYVNSNPQYKDNYFNNKQEADNNYRLKYTMNVNSKNGINSNNNVDDKFNSNIPRLRDNYNQENSNFNNNPNIVLRKNENINNKIPSYQTTSYPEEHKINSYSGSLLRPNYLSSITREITAPNTNYPYNKSLDNNNASNPNENNYIGNPIADNKNTNTNYSVRKGFSEREEKTYINKNNNFDARFAPNRNYAYEPEKNDVITKVNNSNFYSNKDLKNPEQFKLDENSKTFLMEKLNKIKSNENNSYNYNGDMRPNYNYRPNQ